jgi:hypothetical protein
MSEIRITSTEPPFNSAAVAFRATRVIAQADAMGLLGDLGISRLDLPIMRTVTQRIADAGIGRDVQAAFAAADSDVDIDGLLERLGQALDESPAPAFEWAALTTLFEADALARLLQISPASLRRYAGAERTTPDAVADRLHFVATLVGLLAGSYNEIGIRRWFARRRQQLGGLAPVELLKGRWSSDDDGAHQVRQLAESLLGAGAT